MAVGKKRLKQIKGLNLYGGLRNVNLIVHQVTQAAALI
jgi:hypothetical protein